jgi:hypothetical protein
VSVPLATSCAGPLSLATSSTSLVPVPSALFGEGSQDSIMARLDVS